MEEPVIKLATLLLSVSITQVTGVNVNVSKNVTDYRHILLLILNEFEQINYVNSPDILVVGCPMILGEIEVN